MRYRRLDENGDYTFGHNEADFLIDSSELVAQSVLTRLRLWQGEYFLNIEEGTPYQTQVLGFRKLDIADQAIRERILDTDGVESLESYSSKFNEENREFSVRAEINTIYGTEVIEDVFRGSQ